jgi:dolichyl-phosphate-mannose-protein mannosyltransferase
MYGEMVPRRHLWFLTAVVAVAALLRLVNLGSPRVIYFDETYYANDARVYLHGVAAYNHPLDENPDQLPSQPPPSIGVPGEKAWVHPPLGKWVIAAGEAIAGSDSPWGWRIGPALFGILTVVMVFTIGLELLGGARSWAALASAFAALDGLLIVESRISMLDSILAGFVCVGAWCSLRDRRLIVEAEEGEKRPWYGTGWRLGAGLAFGAATATKWSGGLALAAGIGLLIAWSVSSGRLRHELPGAVVGLVVAPAIVYIGSYIEWFARHGLTVTGFFDLHRQMLRYHTTLSATHTYQSAAWTWPLLRRPIAYYYTEGGNLIHHILAVGNPGLWWGFLIALPGLVWLAALKERWQARAVLAFLLAQYLPWLVVGRVLFLYYMAPVVPFMALGLVMVLEAAPYRLRLGVTALFGLAVLVGAILLLPLWIGYGVDRSLWQHLVLRGTWLRLNWI